MASSIFPLFAGGAAKLPRNHHDLTCQTVDSVIAPLSVAVPTVIHSSRYLATPKMRFPSTIGGLASSVTKMLIRQQQMAYHQWRSGLASRQRHVAASAGVAIAHLQRDVAAVAANGAASADRDVAARTSGLGVARGELHAAAVAGGAASAGLHGHVAAVARCATCSGRQRHRAAVGCGANTCRDRHCAAGAPRPATISISPPVLVLVDEDADGSSDAPALMVLTTRC